MTDCQCFNICNEEEIDLSLFQKIQTGSFFLAVG
nr:MAG TPA: hypothetical protein [Caudoviricetes sp.]